MTKFTTHTAVELDNIWVDGILSTGFDAHYGACWYWLNEQISARSYIRIPHPTQEGEELLIGVHLTIAEEADVAWRHGYPEMITIDAPLLSEAAGRVLNDFAHTETARQLRRALETPDEAPDLDAEAADVLIQLAVFDDLVFS